MQPAGFSSALLCSSYFSDLAAKGQRAPLTCTAVSSLPPAALRAADPQPPLPAAPTLAALPLVPSAPVPADVTGLSPVLAAEAAASPQSAAPVLAFAAPAVAALVPRTSAPTGLARLSPVLGAMDPPAPVSEPLLPLGEVSPGALAPRDLPPHPALLPAGMPSLAAPSAVSPLSPEHSGGARSQGTTTASTACIDTHRKHTQLTSSQCIVNSKSGCLKVQK